MFGALFIGIYPYYRMNATPGLFLVGLKIFSIDGGDPSIFQLLSRATMALYAPVAVYFVTDFILSHLFQVELGNIVGWSAIFSGLILNSPIYVKTRGRMLIHEVVSKTYIAPTNDISPAPTNFSLKNTIIPLSVAVPLVIGLISKTYSPILIESQEGALLQQELWATEARAENLLPSSDVLIGDSKYPQKYSIEGIGIPGFIPISKFKSQLEERGVNDLVNSSELVPTYSITVTTWGQLSADFQEDISRQLMKWLGAKNLRVCVVNFVSRTSLLNIITVRISRGSMLLNIDLRQEGRSVVLIIPTGINGITLFTSHMAEEEILLMQEASNK